MRRWTLPTLALLSLAACGDGRLKKLSTGIDTDSLAVLMETDAPHTSTSYLTEGRYWEIYLYTRGNAGAESGDTVAWRAMSPVVLADGKVTGWGWDYLEQTAARIGVTLPATE